MVSKVNALLRRKVMEGRGNKLASILIPMIGILSIAQISPISANESITEKSPGLIGPVISIEVDGNILQNNSGVVDFGTTNLNSNPLTKTFTVTNIGDTNLIISEDSIIFSDSFDSDTSSNYSLFTGDNDSFRANFGMDTTNLTLSDESTAPPESPNYNPANDTANRALFTQVNVLSDGGDNPSFLSIYPDVPTLSGNHEITVDVLYRISSPGTTEYLGCGLNSDIGSIPDIFDVPELDNIFQTGYFGGLFPDYDVGRRDLFFNEGFSSPNTDIAVEDGIFGWGLSGPQPTSITLTNPDGPWLAETTNPSSLDFSSMTDFNGEDLFETALESGGPYNPFNYGGTEGVPLDEWFTIKLSYVDGIVVYSLKPINEPDFEVICTYDDPDNTFTSGNPFIFHHDVFSSSNEDLYVLFDNLEVSGVQNANISVPEPFYITNNNTTTIPPSQSATFTIELPTTQEGEFSGTVSVESNATNTSPSFNFDITGEIEASGPQIQVRVDGEFIETENQVIDIGKTIQFGQSLDAAIMITNTGDQDLFFMSEPTLIFEDNFDSDTSSDYSIASTDSNYLNFEFGTDTQQLTLSDNSTPPSESPNFDPVNDLPNRALQTQVNLAFNSETDISHLIFYPNLAQPFTEEDHQITFDVLYRRPETGRSFDYISAGLLSTKNGRPELFEEPGVVTEFDSGVFSALMPSYDTGASDLIFREGLTEYSRIPEVDSAFFGWGNSAPRPAALFQEAPDGPWNIEVQPAIPGSVDAALDFGEDLFETVNGTNGGVYQPFGGLDGENKAGAPIDEWFTYRMTYIDGTVSLLFKPINEPEFELIAAYDDPDNTFTSGYTFFGHQDPLGGFESEDTYVLFDNIKVESLENSIVDVEEPFVFATRVPEVIGPGLNRSFHIRLDSFNEPGIYNGKVSIRSNVEGEDSEITFELMGEILDPIPPEVTINFPDEFEQIVPLEETTYNFFGSATAFDKAISRVEWKVNFTETNYDTPWLPASITSTFFDMEPSLGFETNYTNWKFDAFIPVQPGNYEVSVRAFDQAQFVSESNDSNRRLIEKAFSGADVLTLTEFTDIWSSINVMGDYTTQQRINFLGFRHDYPDGWQAVTLDLDGNQLDDIITVTEFGEFWYALNLGNRTFTEPIRGSAGYRFFLLPGTIMADDKVYPGDFNGDGFDDLLQVTNLNSRRWIGLNDGTGFIPPPTLIETPGPTPAVGRWMGVGNFHNDPKNIDDIIALSYFGLGQNSQSGLMTVFEVSVDNEGDVNIAPGNAVLETFFLDGGRGYGLVIGDFDGNGLDDLCQINPDTEALVLSTLPDGSTGTEYSGPKLWGTLGFRMDSELDNGWWVYSGDVNGDGRDDLIQLNGVGEIWTALSLENNTFGAPVKKASLGFRHTPEGPWQSFVGEFEFTNPMENMILKRNE